MLAAERRPDLASSLDGYTGYSCGVIGDQSLQDREMTSTSIVDDKKVDRTGLAFPREIPLPPF